MAMPLPTQATDVVVSYYTFWTLNY